MTDSVNALQSAGETMGTGYIIVVGAQNIDIFGSPDNQVVYKDSNPGKVRISKGGVGRNIAHNLRLFGEEVHFITAFGEDLYEEELRRDCGKIGLDITHSLTVKGGFNSVYMFITDEHGDMELAVSDMNIYENITPDFLSREMDVMNSASLCILDTNLTEAALTYICNHCKSRIFVDTVSTTKAVKVKKLLGRIHTVKTNLLEAEAITGIHSGEENALVRMADYFLTAGTEQIYISLGKEGIYCADKTGHQKFSCYPSNMINATGAGDCLMAALAWSFKQGYALKESALAGLAAASICIAGSETVNEELSKEKVIRLVKSRLIEDENNKILEGVS